MNMDITTLSTRTKKARKFEKKTQRCSLHIFMKTNFCTENSILPPDLKVADVTPAFKMKSKTSKDI